MQQGPKHPKRRPGDLAHRETLTVKEAAKALGISESLVRDSVKRAELRAYKYGRRKTIIYREDLEAFKESHRIEVEKS